MVFVGMTTLDYVYYSDNYPRNNSKIKTNNYKRYVGGPAANAAITYSILGGKATLVTCLGSNSEEKLIKSILNDYGVTVLNCANDKKMPNVSTIFVDKEGNRTIFSGQNLYSEIEPLVYDEAPAFYLFDLNQQEISLDILRRAKGNIILDAGSWKNNASEYLRKADVIISSENFLDPSGKNIFEIDEIRDKKLAITRGERDILLKEGMIKVNSVDCVDSLAAGDIFHGAFCYAHYVQNKSFLEALEYASIIASESVKYVGPREWVRHIHL